jgi:hypothetical protein
MYVAASPPQLEAQDSTHFSRVADEPHALGTSPQAAERAGPNAAEPTGVQEISENQPEEPPMPYYEYRCPSNGRTVEVRHGMHERLETWGEVAARAGLGLADTPADAMVERLLSAPVPVTAATSDQTAVGCGPGCVCARAS